MLHCTFSACLSWVGSGLVRSENVGLGWVVKKVGWVVLVSAYWTDGHLCASVLRRRENNEVFYFRECVSTLSPLGVCLRRRFRSL